MNDECMWSVTSTDVCHSEGSSNQTYVKEYRNGDHRVDVLRQRSGMMDITARKLGYVSALVPAFTRSALVWLFCEDTVLLCKLFRYSWGG